MAQLPQALRRPEVGQPVPAEVGELAVARQAAGEQVRRLLGQHDLAAQALPGQVAGVGRGREAAARAAAGLAGVHAHPRQHRAARQLALQRQRAADRIGGGREHPQPVAPALATDRQAGLVPVSVTPSV